MPRVWSATRMTRTIWWENDEVCMIDQRLLPAVFEIVPRSLPVIGYL